MHVSVFFFVDHLRSDCECRRRTDSSELKQLCFRIYKHTYIYICVSRFSVNVEFTRIKITLFFFFCKEKKESDSKGGCVRACALSLSVCAFFFFFLFYKHTEYDCVVLNKVLFMIVCLVC